MLTILLHSSKTMRSIPSELSPYQPPQFLDQARELDTYLKTLSLEELATIMNISPTMADKTKLLIDSWSTDKAHQSPAIDTFLGDIYSGLQVQTFDDADRQFADRTLFILSGLYGVLRPLDSIQAYRLELGYKLPDDRYRNLYTFWGDSIARSLPPDRPIVNVSSVEYTKAVFPYLTDATIVTPKFLTRDPKSGDPKFVTVHAKVARGAFAHWLIKHRVTDLPNLIKFEELNYRYDPSLSTETEPVFVCDTFGGLGLSVRLT